MASGRNMWKALEKRPAVQTKKLNIAPKSYAQPLRAKSSGIATHTENATAKRGSEYRRRLEQQMANTRDWTRRKF